MNTDEAFDDFIDKSSKLKSLHVEIEKLWNSRKNTQFFTAKEMKKIDLKILEFLEECACELAKIEDEQRKEAIQHRIYLLSYGFSLDGNEEEISEPVKELFYIFMKEKSASVLLEKVKLSRKRLSEVYVGF